MNDDQQTTSVPSSHEFKVSSPRSYRFVWRLSRRLGKVATGSYVSVKEFLGREVSISPSSFLVGAPMATLQKAARLSRRKAEQVYNSAADLRKLVKQSREVLASANTVFPLTLFPDSIFVDRTKVTITRRDFFWTSDTMSIRIEDVLNVSITVGPLFGSLTIASRVMSTIDHFKIDHLWRNDAILLMHVIQGYVIARHSKVDTTNLKKDELVRTLIELGNDAN